MLDPHRELQEAWQAIIAAGGPEKVPQAMAKFNELPFEYDAADQAAQSLRISDDNSASEVAATLRQWSETMRANYREAARLAREGR